MKDEENEELEAFIEDWHCDKQSHRFAQDLGRYLFQFIDHLYEQGLTEKTLRKHIDNCWAIGILESGYGYRHVFSPGEIFASPIADYKYEYGRKFSDSNYALRSYEATWKKLYKYTRDLGHLGDE